jgi:hypothetical protein
MAKKQNIQELGLKKTMVKVAEQLVSEGITLSDAVIAIMQPAEGTTSNGPREITILRDGPTVDANVLGRKCTVTGLFFPIDRFAKNTSCIKEADAAKGKLYNESKAMEKDAMAVLDEAREIEDAMEKVAKFEEYDQKLLDAKAHRSQEVQVDKKALDGGFATIEELASSLGVEVIAPEARKQAE